MTRKFKYRYGEPARFATEAEAKAEFSNEFMGIIRSSPNPKEEPVWHLCLVDKEWCVIAGSVLRLFLNGGAVIATERV